MSISQRGSTMNASSSSANSAGCSRPTGVQSGDVLTALVTSNDGSITSSGWTVVGAASGQPDPFNATWLYKVAGSSEPSSYTFSNDSGTNPPIVISIMAWIGVDHSSSPIAGHTGTGSGSSTEPKSTGSCTSTPVAMPIYSRSCRVASDPSPGHPMTFSSSDTELDDTGQWSGGTVSYSHGIYKGTEASGNPPALNITATGSGGHSESDNVVHVLTLKTLITNASVQAGVAEASATAPAAAGTAGRAAFAQVAEAVAETTDINFTPLVAAPATAGANDTSIGVKVNAGVAQATAVAGDIQHIFHGSPPGRVFKVPAESRTYTIIRSAEVTNT